MSLVGTFLSTCLVLLHGGEGTPPVTSSEVTETLPPQRQTPWKGKPISLSLKDADVREVLRLFAEIGNFNLVLDPSVEGTVTVELSDIPWDQALHVILRTHGLAAEIDGRIWSVEDGVPGPARTRSRPAGNLPR